ncbi:NYN domain-containing protein [Polaromonas sp. YR568]|uniref:NYN domain-containing protein n=1 Tax=Polaromonas sp. YR568 TaxID=1855301 RepID=UPI000B822431|nr:NYN domain-containing protein [Polaromonas sp. YR568]
MKVAKQDEYKIALLIDADNAPAAKIEAILSELSTLGVTHVRRAYGNWTKEGLKGWADKLHEHAIRPIQQFDLIKKKNATDIAMTVDALELLYIDQPDAFAIASSDCDFTPLVMHLRAKGAAVFGFGNKDTPPPFVNACSLFLYVENLGEEVDSAAEPNAKTAGHLRTSPAELKQNTALILLLRNSIKAASDEDGWARVSEVGHQVRNQSSDHFRNYGYSSWTKLFKVIDLFELQGEGSNNVAVRDKRLNKAARG